MNEAQGAAGRARRRAGLGLALAAVAALALWHARPLLVWRYTVRPQIEAAGRTARVELRTLRALPRPDPAWPELRAGALRLRAPLLEGQQVECARCAGQCALELEQGRLTFFDSALPDSWSEALAQFAPSSDDLSWWQPSARNWRTLEGLAARASVPNRLPESFRFDVPTSRGIVFRFDSRERERFVVYVYGPDGGSGRVLAVSRTGPELLHQLLGGLELEGGPQAAHCDEGGRP